MKLFRMRKAFSLVFIVPLGTIAIFFDLLFYGFRRYPNGIPFVNGWKQLKFELSHWSED